MHRIRSHAALWVAVALFWLGAPRAAAESVLPLPGGKKHFESAYSKMIVVEQGSLRALYFVRDSGQLAVETAMDLSTPHELQVPYAKAMFASYLLVPEPRRILIVGLGGGAMVHFLEHYEPELQIDAVEIDPVVVEIARDYFGTRASERVNIVTADGVEIIEKGRERYDVIYLDAFLKPSEDTDRHGVPLGMRTQAFYRRLLERVTDDGIIVFNVNRGAGANQHIREIRAGFPMTYAFAPRSNNLILLAGRARETGPAQWRETAKQVDARLDAHFPIAELIDNWVSEPEEWR